MSLVSDSNPAKVTGQCTVWKTVEHLANDLFYYAVQLGPRSPPLDTHVPFALSLKRPDGPAVFLFV